MTPYDHLGVHASASDKAIKLAYRKLARVYHPDNKETGDANEFREIQEAYDLLIDPVRRKRFDETGRTDQHIINDKKVHSFVRNLIRSVANAKDDDPSQDNILGKILVGMEETLHSNTENIDRQRSRLTRIDVLRKRFICDGKVSDQVRLELDEQEKSIKEEIQSLEDMIELNEKVMDFFSHYQYKVDSRGGTSREPTTRSRGSKRVTDRLISDLRQRVPSERRVP